MESNVVDVQSAVSVFTLTEWGKLFLSAFPVEAIQWADKNYKRGNARQEPFRRFTNLCVEFCNQSNVKPAWGPMYQQQRTQGMPPNPKMIENVTAKKERAGEPAEFPESTATPKTFYAGRPVKLLSEEEANIKRNEFINNPDAVAGIEKLAKLIGVKSAHEYFARVFDNLKYEEI